LGLTLESPTRAPGPCKQEPQSTLIEEKKTPKAENAEFHGSLSLSEAELKDKYGINAPIEIAPQGWDDGFSDEDPTDPDPKIKRGTSALKMDRKTHVYFGDHKSIVIDNGSYTTRIGRCGTDTPGHIVPSIMAKTLEASLHHQDVKDGIFYGHTAENSQMHRTGLVKGGMIEDFDKMTGFWTYLFEHEMKITTDLEKFHLVEKADTSSWRRERMMEIFFENFSVPEYFVTADAICNIVAAGEYTGLSIDFGYDSTDFVPVYENSTLAGCSKTLPFGARDLTKFLNSALLLSTDLLVGGGASSQLRLVDQIKESKCYTSPNFSLELSTKYASDAQVNYYELPDGSHFNFGSQAIRVPESYFDPTHLGHPDLKGIHQVALSTIKSCDIDVRDSLLSNVILSGGSSCIEGIERRFRQEFGGLAKEEMKANGNLWVEVGRPDTAPYGSWVGAGVLGSLDSWQSNWIKKSEYEEWGLNIVNARCY
jgi:actin-related protein